MPELRDPVEYVSALYRERQEEIRAQGWDLADVYLELGGAGPRSSELHRRFGDFFNGQTRRVLASSGIEGKLEYWAGIPEGGIALRDQVIAALAADDNAIEPGERRPERRPDPRTRSLILAHNQLDAELHAYLSGPAGRERPLLRARQASPHAAVCVLGMPRSGTSLTARILNVLGVDLGSEEELMAPASGNNPTGFWEHQAIADLNEQILATLGDAPRQRWRWPPRLEEGWEEDPRLEPHRRAARAMLEESFADRRLWGWKDPRTCLTLPFWRGVLAQTRRVEVHLRYVICVRHPLDVAGSLEARDGLEREESLLLWSRYMAEAVVHTSGCPRAFVSYEGYFPAWKEQAIRLAELLDRPRVSAAERAAVAGHIDEGLWHHREARDTRSESALPAEVAELYELLTAVCGSHPPPSIEISLDAEARTARAQHPEDEVGRARSQDQERPLPLVRALKHYSRGRSRAEGPRRPRDDMLIHFPAQRTTVTLPEPREGDCIERPMSYPAGPLIVAELRNGAVLRDGGYVFTAADELLRESVDRRAFADHLSRSHPALQKELEAAKPEAPRDAIAILGGQRAVNYFHWWIDVVAKCWMLENLPYRDCRLMTPPLTQEFQVESLRLLGLDAETLSRPVQRFHRLVFAHGLAPGSAQSLAPQVTEFARWCRARLNLTASTRGRKLFLSRRRARTRRLVNEDEVVAALGPNVERVELESMSVREKADLFSEASLVVAPHGAGLTNLLFCSQPTPVVELVPESSQPATYRQLAGLLGHPYLAVPCTASAEELAGRAAANHDMRAPAEHVATAARRLLMTSSQA